jgi:DNA repair protein RadC
MTRALGNVDLRQASDEEVLAALLGPITIDSLDRARRLLSRVGGYPSIPRSTARELMVAEGVGPATATRIQAAVEAGRRALTTPLERGDVICNSRQVVERFTPHMVDLEQEVFSVVLLDTKHRVIDVIEVSRGCLDSTIVHPRECFRSAIRVGAAAVIALHNHPSGDSTPSAEDRAITHRLVAVGDLVGIELLDHVIVARNSGYSFRDAGNL